MFKPAMTAVAAVLTLSTFAGLASAHSGASGVVKQRMDMMKDISDRMKQIGAMIRGQAAFDAETVSAAADSVAGHAGKMPEMFPEGSAGGVSEALPAIWENWQDFTDLAGELEARATALSEAAQGASGAAEIEPHFADLGRTCSGCHENFREAD